VRVEESRPLLFELIARGRRDDVHDPIAAVRPGLKSRNPVGSWPCPLRLGYADRTWCVEIRVGRCPTTSCARANRLLGTVLHGVCSQQRHRTNLGRINDEGSCSCSLDRGQPEHAVGCIRPDLAYHSEPSTRASNTWCTEPGTRNVSGSAAQPAGPVTTPPIPSPSAAAPAPPPAAPTRQISVSELTDKDPVTRVTRLCNSNSLMA
jgi:hypothetical protein